MKKLTPLLFLLPLTLSGQIKVDHPELVYPILEEFIAENYLRKKSVLGTLFTLDSIVVKDLGWTDDEPPFQRKNYGFHHYNPNTGRRWIEIDKVLLDYPQQFESVLKHELGHVFKLPHLLDKKDEMEFMSEHHYIYYIDALKWRQLNDSYYQSLNPPQ